MQAKLNVIAIASILIVCGVKADLCAVGSTNIGGNWFCQPVQAIRYSNVGSSGYYKQIVNMTSDGGCISTLKKFGGPLSPLDEEVSLHFRGPIRLRQLAAYTPSMSSKKKKRRAFGPDISRHGHKHQQLHQAQKAKEVQKRQMVTATIDGHVVSWENNWFGETAAQTGSASPKMVTATIDGKVVSWVNNWFGTPSSTQYTTGSSIAIPSTSKTAVKDAIATGESHKGEGLIWNPVVLGSSDKQAHAGIGSSAGDVAAAHGTGAGSTYERIGYYRASTQTNENLVFLGNHGGQGSGVFDSNFGASLSYCNRHGTGGAAEPQILADTTIPSDAEVIVMLGEDCSDGGCGFSRPGAVAHHGFDGADKVFLIEFSMPMDGTSGLNGDMPAIWMLNAQIPRTLQYGNAECSCWESGCGEFDVAEALSPGSSYLKSTLHTNNPGGDSDYFVRPSSGMMKLAVMFDSSEASVYIQVLPEHIEFPTTLNGGELKKFCSDTAANKVSHFHTS